MATVLYLDEDPTAGDVVEAALSEGGHATVRVTRIPDAFEILGRETVDLVIADYRVQALTGVELLELLRRQNHDVPLIVVADGGDVEEAVACVKAGAVDYLCKPVQPERLRVATDQALECARLYRKSGALKPDSQPPQTHLPVVGSSEAMARVLDQVAKVATTRVTVLLQGESGTGKEILAREIHQRSDRRNRPFIKLNCAALPETLIESALFGHERGAFTGAVRRVEGAFERADGGTLLLDEISEMKLELQAKLLRVLQEREFERIGGSAPVRVDVRVIATTNRNLAEEAAAKRFRHDLYYRLSVFPLILPPLRDRLEDLEALAVAFATRMAAELNKPFERVAPEALRLLRGHSWPGNVRELQHAVERAVILSNGPVLGPECFEDLRPLKQPAAALPSVSANALHDAHRFPAETTPLDVMDGIVLRTLNVEDAEFALIRRALELTNDNRTKAAAHLGMSVRTLRNKLNARQERTPTDEVPAWQETPPSNGNSFQATRRPRRGQRDASWQDSLEPTTRTKA